MSILKKLLANISAAEEKAGPSSHGSERVAVATAVICLEMANADNEFSEEEQRHIPRILTAMFQLTEDEATDIMESATEEIEHSLDLWQFTNVINENFDLAGKKEIITAVWRLVYADGTLDKHEDYLMHKLSKLLNLPHNDLIDAKLKARGRSR